MANWGVAAVLYEFRRGREQDPCQGCGNAWSFIFLRLDESCDTKWHHFWH